MAASDHLQPYQLSLFMPARELMDLPSGDSEFGYSLANDDALRIEKMREARRGTPDSAWEKRMSPDTEGFLDNIRREGVKNPVLLVVQESYMGKEWDVNLDNGNHRVVSAFHVDPNMEVPVTYNEDY